MLWYLKHSEPAYNLILYFEKKGSIYTTHGIPTSLGLCANSEKGVWGGGVPFEEKNEMSIGLPN